LATDVVKREIITQQTEDLVVLLLLFYFPVDVGENLKKCV